ncbi:alpha/beta fold hydrolase [Microbacterium sp. cx-59]|uniref:alpha/beta fold hydrolase n=1 Tax=Microbacterium sp. cx-59 TaxID=2891207 RepID=UPI001E4A06D0|nr:alpha/beta hydrolase [Microbacterium sp. cx-59]MCC4909425.1 alpha/beta hydrolase [Microbacterium sp. cx-59]
MESRPHIVLVHGAWVGGWEFAGIIPLLQHAGWSIETVELPSTGSTGTMSADADAVTAALDRAPGPVLLVGHSYGGVPVTQAGDHRAVAGIVYVAAFALDQNESVQSALGGELPGVWSAAEGQVRLGADRAALVALVSTGLPPGTPPAVGEQLADMFRPQSLASLTEPVRSVAWRTKPSWYVLTENDDLVPPDFQRSLAERAGAEIIRVPTGHAPFQEAPADFVAVIERIAAELPQSTPNTPHPRSEQ